MEGQAILLILTLLFVKLNGENAESAACAINQCQCSKSTQWSYNDVSCFVTSITAADPTITSLPPDVQSLILNCPSLESSSILSDGIFQKLSFLRSLTIYQCKINIITAGSFIGLQMLKNLSISYSGLPQLGDDTFTQLPGLQFLTIVYCNLSTLPDISHMKSLQYLNIAHNKLYNISIKTAEKSHDSVNITETASLGDLRTLDLSYNSFSSLPLNLLIETPRLQHLYLMGLSLTKLEIPNNILLKDLITLDASENSLLVVNFSSIAVATGINTLHLEGTGLPLQLQDLSYLRNIEVLSLNNFDITDTIWHELNSTKLSKLNLAVNNLTTIDISQVPDIRVLLLHFNRISNLSNVTFINQPALLLVNLSRNNVQALPANIFKNNYNLKVIDFSVNHISRLESDSLKGLNQVFFLDLSSNLISYLPYTIFKDMSSMMNLYIRNNRLTYLPKLSYMSELVFLDISYNHISTISSHDFSGLYKLESLFANNNKLTILPPNLLSECPGVRHVLLQNNYITSMGTLGDHPNLRILEIDNNQLTDFIAESPFVQLPQLEYLSIERNNLTTLKYRMFPPSIQGVFLGKNQIKNIHTTCFRDLPRLNSVSLAFNKYVLSIPQSAMNVFKYHSPKPTISILGNTLYCDCEMGYMKVLSVEGYSKQLFQKNYARVEGLDSALCSPGHDSEVARPFKDVPLSDFVCQYTETWCDFLCDCCMQATKCKCLLTCPRECACFNGGSVIDKTFTNINCQGRNLEYVPSEIPSRAVVLFLDGNKFNHISKHDVGHLRETEIIYLNNSGIQLIEDGTFDDISALKILFLNDNFLTTIGKTLFGKMEGVKKIYLHNNLVHDISPVAFSALKNIEVITLHNNRLVYLTAVPKISQPMSLTLSGNPWSCNCDLSKVIIRTLYEINKVIVDSEKMCCYFYQWSVLSGWEVRADQHHDETYLPPSTESIKDTHVLFPEANTTLTTRDFSKDCRSLLRFNYEDYCAPKTFNSSLLKFSNTSNFHPGFIALTVITTILLLLASIVVFVLYKRHEIQAWVFVRLGVRILDKKVQLDKEEGAEKVFDAFISYSSKDEEFIAANLVPVLENGNRKYRLCVHYRDFPVGRNITDTIYRAIENSSRTILLLTVNFLQSEWCRFEFQTAHHYILREGSHKLIIVIMGDIPEDMLDPDLKVHLKSKTYLKYGDPWFWEKLYFALPSIKNRDKHDNDWDILQGMRILAGDELVGEETNHPNQQGKTAPEITSQGLNIINNSQRSENDLQRAQDEGYKHNDILSNERDLVFFHINMGFVNLADNIKNDDYESTINDIELEVTDKKEVNINEDDERIFKGKCKVDVHADGENQYFNKLSDSMNNLSCSTDDNNDDDKSGTNCREGNVFCFKQEISKESIEEIDNDCKADVNLISKNDVGNDITDETREETRN